MINRSPSQLLYAKLATATIESHILYTKSLALLTTDVLAAA
jgi:hypothetical protein